MTSAPGLARIDTWERQIAGPPVRTVDVLAIGAAMAGLAAVSHIIAGVTYGTGPNSAPIHHPPSLLYPVLAAVITVLLSMAIQQARRLFRRHTRWIGGAVICRFEGGALRVARRWRGLARTAWIDLGAPAEVWVYQEDPGYGTELLIVDDKGQHVLLGMVDALEAGEALGREIVMEAGHRGASWTWRAPDVATWLYGHIPAKPPDATIDERAGELHLAVGVGEPDAEPPRLGRDFRVAIAVGIVLGAVLGWSALQSAGTTVAYVLFSCGVGVALLPMVVATVHHAWQSRGSDASVSITATRRRLMIRDAQNMIHSKMTWQCHPRWLAGVETTDKDVSIEHRLRHVSCLFKRRTPAERAWLAAHLRHHYRIPRRR